MVNYIVNAIRSVGRKIEEGDVVRNILLILPKPYNSMRCAIKESLDLDNCIIDQLLRLLAAYEICMREEIKRERKETTFNVSKMAEDEPQESENMDEIKQKFMRRLKGGTKKIVCYL